MTRLWPIWRSNEFLQAYEQLVLVCRGRRGLIRRASDFTKLAAEKIGDGLGGFMVEATAALTILGYLIYLKVAGQWQQNFSLTGVGYSVLTGICVGAGTIVFFLLFQKGGPLSAVPMILAGGAAIMATAGILFFKEPVSLWRVLGVVFSIAGLLLLRK